MKKKINFERIKAMNVYELSRFLSCLCINAEMQNPIPLKTKYTPQFFFNWLNSTEGKAENVRGE